MSTNSTTQQNVQQPFLAFYEGWLRRKQSLLEQLHGVPDEIHQQNKLIEMVLSHYQEYFEEKAKMANHDAFLLFSPTWLSSYERALHWVGDYKPTLIMRLAECAVEADLTAEQRAAVGRVESETRRSERELSGALAGIQESVANPRVLGMARRVGRELDGEIDDLDATVEAMKRALLDVLEKGDELRVATVRKLVGVLTPPQTVRFLAAAMEFQLRARRWGSQIDGSRDL